LDPILCTGLYLDTFPRRELVPDMTDSNYLPKLKVEKKISWWYNPYLILFVISLILRLFYFGEVLDKFGAQKLTEISEDITHYYASAQEIAKSGNYCTRGIHIFGPGYPTCMAAMGAWVNFDPVIMSILNILLNSLSTILLTYFAYQLTSNMIVSIFAGIQHALSIVSIALSAILLSETLFFFLLLLALILLLKGLTNEKFIYFLIASILFGALALIRSVGQFLPVLVLFIAMIYNWKLSKTNFRKFLKSLVGPLAIALVTGLVVSMWISHNARVHKFADLTISAPFGVSKVVRLIRAEINNTTYEEETERFFKDLKNQDAYRTGGYDRAMSVYSKELLYKLIAEHPFSGIKVFMKNVWKNITAEWGGHYLLITGYESWKKNYAVNIASRTTILRYRIVLFVLLGSGVLFFQRNRAILMILLGIAVYFVFFSGFTLDQGPRLLYPGQAGWAVLLAYGLTWSFAEIKKQVVRCFIFVKNLR